MADIVVVTGRSDRRLEFLLQAHLQRNLKDGELRLIVSPDGHTRSLAGALGIETLDPAGDASLADQVRARCDPVIIVEDTGQPLPPDFLRHMAPKVIALRAALPGQFPGPDPEARAWEASRRGEVRWSGCHLFRRGADGRAARVIRQVVVPIAPGDDRARYTRRMAQAEKWVLLKGIKQLLYERRNAPRHARRPSGRRSTSD